MSAFGPLGTLLIYVVPFLFILTVVVFFHELGHFLVGRWCGIKVDAFSLGFGPEICAFVDRKGTRWRLAALPLGGYVKFHGDANAVSGTPSDDVPRMSVAERSVTFFGQPVWKRAAVVAAGPIANFILAVVIFTVLFVSFGRPVLLPRVDAVTPGGAAEVAGFKPGDIVLAIDGRTIDNFAEMQRIVSASADTPLIFLVNREGVATTLEATPRLKELSTPLGKTRVGLLGVEAGAHHDDWRTEHYSLLGSIQLAGHETWYVIERTMTYVGGLFVGRESPDQLSGVIGTAQVAGEMAKLGFGALLNLAAILSISIGLLNLFPIPLLDGGHLMFYAIEALRGRALNERAQEYGFRVGLAIVCGLMIFATYNDISRITRQLMHWG
ncbi:MAG: RIP metalloprotease [Methylobacteriaceae bacterium]|nr:RIP metalloprotease [Methylobacteriaceae bacterium]